MSESQLDQIVKGAPSPSTFPAGSPTSPTPIQPASSDPLASLPSSPPQIYLNLLILEASLRAQYLELRARRRQHTFFLALLVLWIVYFYYALFLAPREDGSGVGGSVYWVVEVTEKVCLMGGIVTALLVWGTGQWERGIRWPRRWVGTTNRGLRGFNCKIVVVKGPWWKEWRATLMFFVSNGLLLNNNPSTYRYIPPSVLSSIDNPKTKSPLSNIQEDGHRLRPHGSGHYEDLSPGGDTIALLLLPKPFSPSFRENWDLYRTAYWESENARRATLLHKLHAHDRHLRSQQSWWNRWRHPLRDVEKSSPSHTQGHGLAHPQTLTHKIQTAERRLRSNSSSHSRTSSRSSTPGPDQDETVSRRGSNSSAAGSVGPRRGSSSGNERRAKNAVAGSLRVQKMTAASSTLSSSSAASGSTGSGQSSRAGTPTVGEYPRGPGVLAREGSFDSVESLGGSGGRG